MKELTTHQSSLARRLFTGVAISAIAALTMVALVGQQQARTITVHRSMPDYSLGDLASQATLVALVEVRTLEQAHWSSPGNREWKAEPLEPPAYIYRDHIVSVVEVLKGSPPAGQFQIRTVGGKVGNVQMVVDGSADWNAGAQYLAFLRYIDTPIRGGREPAWVVAHDGEGLFASEGGSWRQLAGRQWVVSNDELRDAVGS